MSNTQITIDSGTLEDLVNELDHHGTESPDTGAVWQDLIDKILSQTDTKDFETRFGRRRTIVLTFEEKDAALIREVLDDVMGVTP